MYTIITENDESMWEDETGVLYHFPKRYKKLLEPGTELIYYKGKLKNKAFREERLSDEPHYFAKARIGKVYPDTKSTKDDWFATIVDFSQFSRPVLAKNNNGFFEVIPESQLSNYWRNGVRQIDKVTYDKILQQLSPNEFNRPRVKPEQGPELNDISNGLESYADGEAKTRFVTVYERNPQLRKQAIAIHGCSCKACGFNFGEFYGEYAEGYIHIHHVQPVSELDAPKTIDPEKDLVPLCANCHSIVHRRKGETLSLAQLNGTIKAALSKSCKNDAIDKKNGRI